MENKKVQQEHQKQNIKVAVDNCIFTIKDGKLQLILIQMKEKLAGNWALPGGLVTDDESIDNAAKRILNEQTAVKDVYLEQLYTFGDTDRDPFARVVSSAYFALIPSNNRDLKTSKRYSDVKWFDINDLPELAYDHKDIVKYAKKRLQWKIKYTNVAWSLLPEKFTLTDLQTAYEIILEKKLDKRNFRKKILKLGLIEETGEKTKLEAHRPAMLYKFISKKPEIIEIF